jgi:DNA primase
MDAKDEVKSRISIEDVIGSYVELKRAGRNWKALSPFTNEKTASFIVSPEKQIWHDFSSGKGGDVFSFVMEVEGLDFKETLDLLARRAGVDLSQYQSSSGRSSSLDKNRLYEALELATKFYQVQFSKNKEVLDYVLKTRGFTKDTALKWQIGYSPNTGDALIKFLKIKGFNDKEMQLAGLVSVRGANSSDMFRGRLMIPLADSQGRVIGYTARILGDENNGPKYINTPQTALYDKSRHVFGLHLAKASIRESGYAVLVEGNLDVIASYQAGVKQVVATAGTAMTVYQLQALSRLTNDVRLCFDADKAGIAATERAIPIASSIKLNLSIVSLQSGKDPDELIMQDPQLWQKDIDNKKYALDWLVDFYSKNLDLTSAPGKRQFTDKLLPIISALDDEVEKDHYVNQLSKLIDINPEAINDKLKKSGTSTPARKKIIKTKVVVVDKEQLEAQKTQNNLLSLVLNRQTLRDILEDISLSMMVTENGKELLSLLKEKPDFDLKTDKHHITKLEDYVKIEQLLYEELYSNLDLNELHYEASRLKTRLIGQYVKEQKFKIIEQLSGTISEPETRKLLEKAKKLDQMLNEKGESI